MAPAAPPAEPSVVPTAELLAEGRRVLMELRNRFRGGDLETADAVDATLTLACLATRNFAMAQYIPLRETTGVGSDIVAACKP